MNVDHCSTIWIVLNVWKSSALWKVHAKQSYNSCNLSKKTSNQPICVLTITWAGVEGSEKTTHKESLILLQNSDYRRWSFNNFLEVDNLELQLMILKIPGLNVEESSERLGVTCLSVPNHRCCWSHQRLLTVQTNHNCLYQVCWY